MPRDTSIRREQGERLKQARVAAGFEKAADAVKRFNWGYSTYAAHENGQNGIPAEEAVKYGAAFGVDAGWILTASGQGPRPRINQSPQNGAKLGLPNATIARLDEVARGEALQRNLPVMGAGACGEDGLFEFNQGEPIAVVRRPPGLEGVRDAYAVYVCGDSMAPWREPGQLVCVNPHQQPKPGDYVLIQLKPTDGTENRPAYIKRLVQRGPTTTKVAQFNPAKEFSIKNDKIFSIHRIIDWHELLGF